MKVRMTVVAMAAALVVGLVPASGGATPVRSGADAPPEPASAHRVWYSEFGTGVDGMAIDPGTGRAFVRSDATPDGADLMVAGPGSYVEPDRLTGPYGFPVAAAGSIFAFRAGQLRRINPTSLTETGAWTVPGLTADLYVTSAGGDVLWLTRSSGTEQLYRFDPDTGTTSTSGPTSIGYTGPVGGGSALVAWARYPSRLLSIDGTTPGSSVDVSEDVHEIYAVDVSDDGALVTVPDFPEDRMVEFSMPGFVPTGTVYETDRYPVLSASTTAAGGSLAVVSTGDHGPWSLQVFARGNPHAVVDIGLPPMSHVPQIGDLEFSADGKKLFFLVRDQPDKNVGARLVVADLATTVSTVADPIVVGSKGGAVTAITATLGTGTSVTVGGTPVTPTVEVGPVQTLGETHDRISFTVPAMEPGTKLIWLTNALGHQTSGGPVNVMDLGPFVHGPWFVQKQLTDITGKKASPAQVTAGIQQLLADLDAGKYIARLETERGQMTQRAALIRLYRAVFLRPPDTAGLRYWLGRMEKGTRLTQVAATFAGSNEFKNQYGSLSSAQFVDKIYRNVLGRGADPSGRAYWIKKLNAGTSRGVLVAQFAQSNEYVNRMQFDVRIIELRLAMLGRTPTEMELAPLRIKPLADVAWLFLNDPNYSTAG